MTITEMLNIPVGMSFEKYEMLLKRKTRVERQLAKIQDNIYSEMDSLDVLSDEVGTERYNRHLEIKEKEEQKLSKKLKEYEKLKELLNI